MRLRPLLLASLAALAGCATTPPEALRGTGDLGVVIERAAGRVQIVEHSRNTRLATVAGLGDLSHAHVTFSRDGRFAYVFGVTAGSPRLTCWPAASTSASSRPATRSAAPSPRTAG